MIQQCSKCEAIGDFECTTIGFLGGTNPNYYRCSCGHRWSADKPNIRIKETLEELCEDWASAMRSEKNKVEAAIREGLLQEARTHHARAGIYAQCIDSLGNLLHVMYNPHPKTYKP